MNQSHEMRRPLPAELDDRIVAVIRCGSEEEGMRAAEGVIAGGIRCVEVTMTTPGAPRIMQALAGSDRLLVGAGSILSVEQARSALEAGARLIASPIYDPQIFTEVTRIAPEALRMPGAMTPTEMVAAWKGGGDIIKVFPMPTPAAPFVRSILGPLPFLRLAPSGGVDATTAPELLRAGASILNVGSWLTHERGELLDAAEIHSRSRSLLESVRGAITEKS